MQQLEYCETLSSLPNIGSILEKKLKEVDVLTVDQLKSLGAKEVFLRVRAIDSGACLHMLYALEGAIKGVRKACLSQEEKQNLRDFFKTLD